MEVPFDFIGGAGGLLLVGVPFPRPELDERLSEISAAMDGLPSFVRFEGVYRLTRGLGLRFGDHSLEILGGGLVL